MWDIRWFRGANNEDRDDHDLHKVVTGSEFYSLTQMSDLEYDINQLSYPIVLLLYECLQWEWDMWYLWSDYIDAYLLRYWVPQSQLHNIVDAVVKHRSQEYDRVWWLLIGLQYGKN